MPYIIEEVREQLDYRQPKTVGELTYELYAAVLTYIESFDEKFAVYAEVLGALEATKLELYRRSIAPYEDEKLEVNGDV